MVLKKHTGITFTLLGILLPFFGSVCLASANGMNSFFTRTIQPAEKSITFQKDEIPGSKSLVRQDVDFIYRLKNDRFLYRKLLAFGDISFNHSAFAESFFLQFRFVPKPAYYNYLFMFKPF